MSEVRASLLYPSDLTGAERAALVSMNPAGLILHDKVWRTRGLPSRKIHDTAVAALRAMNFGRFLQAEPAKNAPFRFILTAEGRRMEGRIRQKAVGESFALIAPLTAIAPRAEA